MIEQLESPRDFLLETNFLHIDKRQTFGPWGESTDNVMLMKDKKSTFKQQSHINNNLISTNQSQLASRNKNRHRVIESVSSQKSMLLHHNHRFTSLQNEQDYQRLKSELELQCSNQGQRNNPDPLLKLDNPIHISSNKARHFYNERFKKQKNSRFTNVISNRQSQKIEVIDTLPKLSQKYQNQQHNVIPQKREASNINKQLLYQYNLINLSYLNNNIQKEFQESFVQKQKQNRPENLPAIYSIYSIQSARAQYQDIIKNEDRGYNKSIDQVVFQKRKQQNNKFHSPVKSTIFANNFDSHCIGKSQKKTNDISQYLRSLQFKCL